MNLVNIIKYEWRLNNTKMEKNKKTDFEKCTIHKKSNNRYSIKCKLGLWAIEGPYDLSLINEANHYFKQYKADGEYDKLLEINK